MHVLNLTDFVGKRLCSSGVTAVSVAIGASGKTGFSKLLLVFTMVIAAIHVSVANAGVLYVLSGNNSGPDFPSFGTVDVATGLYTEIRPALTKQYVSNLSWNPLLSAFYAIDGDADEKPVLLSTIDTNGTISTTASAMGSRTIQGMAYRQSDSTIYAYDRDGSDYGTIDSGSGAWANLKASGHGISDFGNRGGRFAIHNDTLYLTSSSYDETQGWFGAVGYTSVSTFTQIGGPSDLFKRMILASDGTTLFGLYGNGIAGNQALYSIDPTSGVTSYVTGISGGGLGTSFYGADFGPGVQAVPEPSTCVICLCALACAGFFRRFKVKGAGKSPCCNSHGRI